MPTGRRATPPRVVARGRCREIALAPLVLMVEWFLLLAPLALAFRLTLGLFAEVAFFAFCAAAAQLVLIPLALLPFANAAHFLVRSRARRERLQHFKVIDRR
jgi:hypothetical protein